MATDIYVCLECPYSRPTNFNTIINHCLALHNSSELTFGKQYLDEVSGNFRTKRLVYPSPSPPGAKIDLGETSACSETDSADETETSGEFENDIQTILNYLPSVLAKMNDPIRLRFLKFSPWQPQEHFQWIIYLFSHSWIQWNCRQ